MTSSRIVTCACGCGRTGPSKGGRGWVVACYLRWHKAGCPEGGPPAAMRPYPEGRQQDRLEDYVFLRSSGSSRDEAAQRVGVRSRTAVRRYEVAYREAA